MKQNIIKCPNCGNDIDVQNILSHQLEEEIKQKYQKQIAEEKKQFQSQFEVLKKEKEEFEQKKKQENELFKERLEKQLREERRAIEAKLKAQLTEEQEEQFKALQEELNQKSLQVKELNRSRIEIEKLKREKSELKEEVEAEAQRKLNEALQIEKNRIRKAEQERNEMKFKEMQKQLEDQKRLTEEMKRKQEQGSMQLQGEVQELAIEEFLSAQFPLDTIEEIKKGAFGADCVQTIHTRESQNCGVICYESKNTKAWSDGWVAKLKQDMLKVNADIGVLVTAVYPSDMKRMGFVDGIWVCSIDEFKGSASLLRESLIRVHHTVQKEDNKADKMTFLYNYLTGNEFNMQLNAIVEGFMAMQTELDKERRSLMASWKRRQKLIDNVLQNTTEMYGALQGIAGPAALEKIKALELPDGLEDD